MPDASEFTDGVLAATEIGSMDTRDELTGNLDPKTADQIKKAASIAGGLTR